MNRRSFLGLAGIVGLIASVPLAVRHWFNGMRRGDWIYSDTGKPANFWNGWGRSREEQRVAHEQAWQEMPRGFHQGSDPMTDPRVAESLAKEEIRFALDRERFRAEATEEEWKVA